MRRRQWLWAAVAGLASAPLLGLATVRKPSKRIVYLGDDALTIRNELRRKCTDYGARFEEIQYPSQLRPTIAQSTIIVVNLLDEHATEQLSECALRKGRRDSVLGYGIVPLIEALPSQREVFRTNLALFGRVCDMQRQFMDIDYNGQAIQPQWPVCWTDDALSVEQKQIVWELMKL